MANQAKPKQPKGRPFVKGQSGNPLGRPRKEQACNAERESVASVLARVMATKVTIQDGNGSREVCAFEALLLTTIKDGLKNARVAQRLIEFVAANENNASSADEPKFEAVADLLEDPIVKRHLEREMRKRLQLQGERSAAEGLLQEQYGDPTSEGAAEDSGSGER